jgi:hypothetical protein
MNKFKNVQTREVLEHPEVQEMMRKHDVVYLYKSNEFGQGFPSLETINVKHLPYELVAKLQEHGACI